MRHYKGYRDNYTFAQATKLQENIREALLENVVQFNFNRITYNGAARWAIGTTDLEIISIFGGLMPKGTKPNVPGLIRYFDLQPRDAWRSFYISNINRWTVYDRTDIKNILDLFRA